MTASWRLGVEKPPLNLDKAKSLRAFNSRGGYFRACEIEKQLGRSGEDAKERSLFMDLYSPCSILMNPPASQSNGITREQNGAGLRQESLHGSLNPYASTGKQSRLKEVLQSRHVVGPLTVHMCSPWEMVPRPRLLVKR